MPRSSRRLVFTERYLRSLARLAENLDDEARFDALLEALEVRCQRLRQLPGLGRPAVVQPSGSAQLRDEFARLRTSVPGSELRELVVGDHLLLYLVDAPTVTLAGIRHQREAGYLLAGD